MTVAHLLGEEGTDKAFNRERHGRARGRARGLTSGGRGRATGLRRGGVGARGAGGASGAGLSRARSLSSNTQEAREEDGGSRKSAHSVCR